MVLMLSYLHFVKGRICIYQKLSLGRVGVGTGCSYEKTKEDMELLCILTVVNTDPHI